MARPFRKPHIVPVPARVPMPPRGPVETIVWEEVESYHAFRRLVPCLCVLYHPAYKDRPLCLGPPPPPLVRVLCALLRTLGLRCFIAPLTPMQFEHRTRIARFLVRLWRPVFNREPAPNARLVAVITYPPWAR